MSNHPHRSHHGGYVEEQAKLYGLDLTKIHVCEDGIWRTDDGKWENRHGYWRQVDLEYYFEQLKSIDAEILKMARLMAGLVAQKEGVEKARMALLTENGIDQWDGHLFFRFDGQQTCKNCGASRKDVCDHPRKCPGQQYMPIGGRIAQ